MLDFSVRVKCAKICKDKEDKVSKLIKNQKLFILSIVTFLTILLTSPIYAESQMVAKSSFNMSIAYIITTLIAFILLLGYCALVEDKKIIFIFLFTAVLVINTGYAFASMSSTLEEALLANRISYLGSVFLPLVMLLIIVDECNVKINRIAISVLVGIALVIFVITATPGYSTIYYADVSLIFVNGGARLLKTYGPLHFTYYLYLFTYFALMIIVIFYSKNKKLLKTPKLALFLLLVVIGNIGVWFIEQKIMLDFEFLSVSYIITEVYLLSMYKMIDKSKQTSSVVDEKDELEDDYDIDKIIAIWPEVSSLTTREVEVFMELLADRKRKDIAEALCVTENTVKKHTSHIFMKLDVTSRTEIINKIHTKLKK